MLQIRRATERGDGSFDWLESYHTFSFANYYDPRHMHFSHLRVINEDFIAPENGFEMHPHKDMEILTYVLNGRVAHTDSMGNRSEVLAGEFQIMSAGTGIYHSEINPSNDERLHLYQIWIMPNQKGIKPRYEQGKFAPNEGKTLILSPDGAMGSFKVYQDMRLWRYQFADSHAEKIALSPNRNYWLQVVRGDLVINEQMLQTSDAIAIKNESELELTTKGAVEFLLFDLV